ncbi:MAG: phage major capsid protein [Firmicutes bacterium]|nr:phage major capsid protein [Bacillota bacterium]
MNANVRMKEIEGRIAEIRKISDAASLEELENLELEVDKLNEERNVLSKKIEIAKKFDPTPVIETKSGGLPKEALEKRGLDLREKRTIQVSQDEILLPEHIDGKLAVYPFSEVSTLVDNIKLVNLVGGETYKKTFVKGSGTAGYTQEGADYNESEPSFGYLTITKCKLTAYTEITEELEKLPAINYQSEVIKNIKTSLKKKLSLEILKGAGGSNQFTGIFSQNATALADTTDVEVSEINEDTLDDIIYAYGGPEEVEGSAILILSKADLRAFARLRTEEGRKVHTIDYVNHTIDGIFYIINSNCEAISNSATTTGAYCIAYGSLKNYETAIFSPIEISKSTDYKFKQGIICYKASVFAGGNVVGYKGFVRVKKGAVTPTGV